MGNIAVEEVPMQAFILITYLRKILTNHLQLDQLQLLENGGSRLSLPYVPSMVSMGLTPKTCFFEYLILFLLYAYLKKNTHLGASTVFKELVL